MEMKFDIEEQLQVMAEEIEKLRAEQAVPESRPLESFNGLGPAASKVYFKDRGVSIGSYGEVRLRSDVGPDKMGDDSVYDALRAIKLVTRVMADAIREADRAAEKVDYSEGYSAGGDADDDVPLRSGSVASS